MHPADEHCARHEHVYTTVQYTHVPGRGANINIRVRGRETVSVCRIDDKDQWNNSL